MYGHVKPGRFTFYVVKIELKFSRKCRTTSFPSGQTADTCNAQTKSATSVLLLTYSNIFPILNHVLSHCPLQSSVFLCVSKVLLVMSRFQNHVRYVYNPNQSTAKTANTELGMIETFLISNAQRQERAHFQRSTEQFCECETIQRKTSLTFLHQTGDQLAGTSLSNASSCTQTFHPDFCSPDSYRI